MFAIITLTIIFWEVVPQITFRKVSKVSRSPSLNWLPGHLNIFASLKLTDRGTLRHHPEMIYFVHFLTRKLLENYEDPSSSKAVISHTNH